MPTSAEFASELSMVARHWRKALDARFRDLGLTQARWRALFELSRAGAITQVELAAVLGIEGPTLVRLLDGLESQGLIERHTCAEDRRAKKVHLTPSAEPTLAQMRTIADDLRGRVLDGIPETDLETARRVLATIAERLDTLP